jgi:galactokinase
MQNTHNIEHDFAAFETAAAEPNFFALGTPVHIARAPGRLDVMGGIADYSGSLVAEMPIAQAAVVGAQAGGTEDGAVIVRSANADSEGLAAEVPLPGELFTNPVSLLKHLQEGPKEARWAGYVAGTVSLLRAEGLIPRGVGGRLLVRSEVPLGAGVSSSAGIEVASMRAVTAAFGVPMDGLTLARLCQRVENEIMDAPCGVMDQVTSALGEAGELLLLLCQPHRIEGTLKIPAGWTAFGIDSGVKHSVGGVGYTTVRIAAFMGYKILADRAGSGFRGYLCNLTPAEYLRLMPERLPETKSGTEFLAQHGGIMDTVTNVDSAVTYPVRAAAEHAIYEMERVQRFVAALREGGDSAVASAGKLMYESHDSYSACGLGATETDMLVALAKKSEAAGLAGAKITGGGSGGTVCVLCRAEAEETLAQQLADSYFAATGITPRVIRGTSSGAMATPVRQKSFS